MNVLPWCVEKSATIDSRNCDEPYASAPLV
ncbi:hypothetical protein HDA35_005842 [Micromonospora purpureochromogenes]|uniref:Uncharacterized protein n=1 Tax=Micromonospora purpureochromogenes TaxID=47872 RepID=A0ABX2RY30_9ACTN|nr:hypothetical protein [Micromonospora purpureochromogenes]